MQSICRLTLGKAIADPHERALPRLDQTKFESTPCPTCIGTGVISRAPVVDVGDQGEVESGPSSPSVATGTPVIALPLTPGLHGRRSTQGLRHKRRAPVRPAGRLAESARTQVSISGPLMPKCGAASSTSN
jgi:hypothetical protein